VDDITLVTLRRTAASRLTSKNTYLPGPWVNKRRGTRTDCSANTVCARLCKTPERRSIRCSTAKKEDKYGGPS
jgi:hypothetical protein